MATVTRIIAILLVLDLVTDVYTHGVHSNSGDVLDGIHPTKDYFLDSSPHNAQRKPSPEKQNTTKSQTRSPRKKLGSKPPFNQPQNSVIKQETDLQTRNTTNITPFLSKGKVQQDRSPVLEIFNGFDSSVSKSNKIKPLNRFKDDENNSIGNKDTKLTKAKENVGKYDDAYITSLYDHSKKEDDDDFSGEENQSEENYDENPSEHSYDEEHDDEETDVYKQDYKPKEKPNALNRNKDELLEHPQRYKPRDYDEDLNEEEEHDAPFHQEMLTKQQRDKTRFHWLDNLEDYDILPPSVRSRITKLESYDPKYLDELYRQQSASQRRKFSDRELETKVAKTLKDRPSQNQDTRHSFRPEVTYKDHFHPNPSSIRLRNRENNRQFTIPHGRDQLAPYDKNPLQKYKFAADEQRAETYSNSYLDPKNIKQDSFGDVYVGFPESELQKVLSSRLASSLSKKPQWPREKAVSSGTDDSFPEAKDVSYLSSDYDKVHHIHHIRPPGNRALRVQEAPPSVLKPDPQGGTFNIFGGTRTVQSEHYSYYPPENKNVPLNRPGLIEWHPRVEEPSPLPSRNNFIRPGKQNDVSISELPVVDDWTLSVLEKILGPLNNKNVRRGMTSTVWQPTTYNRPAKRSIGPGESRTKRRVPHTSSETTIVKRSIGPEDDIKDPELSESRIKRSQPQYRSLRINRSISEEEVDSEQWRPRPDGLSSSVSNP